MEQALNYIYTDGTKLALIVKNVNDNYSLQSDLDILIAWAHSVTWVLTEITKVLHIENINREFEYEMEGHWHESIEEKRDLGVLIDNSLNF